MPPQGRCEWNVNQRARLIQLVKQFDIIWLPVGATDKSKISTSRRSAFEQIRQHFLDDGFTVDDLASQWRNLKDIFYKRFKEMNRRIQMSESNVKPPWRFFDALSFLATNKAMDANRREVFGDSLSDAFADGVGMEDTSSNFGMFDELNEGEERMLKEVKQEEQQDDELVEEDKPQQKCATSAEGRDERMAAVNGKQPMEQLQQLMLHHQQQEFMDKMEGSVNSRQQQPIRVAPSRRVKRKLVGGGRNDGVPKRALAYRSVVPQRQLSPIWDGLRQHSFSSALSSSQQRQYLNGTAYSANFLFNKNTPSTSAETAKPAKSASGHGVRSKATDTDRFRYFGVFVESAVRDLFHQCPDTARRLLHSIYGIISEHQMEATLMFGGDESQMDRRQVLLDDLGIDAEGEGTTDGTESLCWMP